MTVNINLEVFGVVTSGKNQTPTIWVSEHLKSIVCFNTKSGSISLILAPEVKNFCL